MKILRLCFFFLIAGSAALAQEAGTPLASEIHTIERSISTAHNSAETTPESRQDALMRLAGLQQLAGDIESASRTWLAAVAVPQGPHADTALVSAAYCLAAMGDWEKAGTVIAPVLRENRQGQTLRRARYLEACAGAWAGTDASHLRSLAQNPEYSELHSAIYYTLWKCAGTNPEMPDAGSAGEWKARLLAEFPRSPEALIAAAETAQAGAPAVRAKPSPLWLFLPGAYQLVPAAQAAALPVAALPVAAHSAPATAPQTVEPAAIAAQTVPPIPPPTVPPPMTTPPVSSNTPAPPVQTALPAPAATPPTVPHTATQPAAQRVLQTGLFSVEANAKNQAEQLRKAGFSAEPVQRTVNGKDFWAVTVPAGANMNQTIADLKKAGFDSFPL